MSQNNENSPLNIIEYKDWIVTQKFKDSEELHQYVSCQEQDFLQNVIYPMFYKHNSQFKTSIPFPLILKDYSSKKPKYVIDDIYFTIIFFSYDNLDDEMCWEVSVHIKDHNFCNKRIKAFKNWYLTYYRPFSELKDMPEEFVYPALRIYDKKVQDFSIEFWNSRRDFILFKLMDVLRIF